MKLGIKTLHLSLKHLNELGLGLPRKCDWAFKDLSLEKDYKFFDIKSRCYNINSYTGVI